MDNFYFAYQSEASNMLQRFYQFIITQFRVFIRYMHCDNGGEFLNTIQKYGVFSKEGMKGGGEIDRHYRIAYTG